jgi:hypothetical protein
MNQHEIERGRARSNARSARLMLDGSIRQSAGQEYARDAVTVNLDSSVGSARTASKQIPQPPWPSGGTQDMQGC